MDDNGGQIISFEEAARRRRAAGEAQKGAIHEVHLSDAMSHLLEEEGSAEAEGTAVQTRKEGPSPEELRQIVEREFADERGRSGPEPEERPRPHLVPDPEEDHGGRLCSFETRKCWDPVESPDGPPEE
jgi:hypothetical protein